MQRFSCGAPRVGGPRLGSFNISVVSDNRFGRVPTSCCNHERVYLSGSMPIVKPCGWKSQEKAASLKTFLTGFTHRCNSETSSPLCLMKHRLGETVETQVFLLNFWERKITSLKIRYHKTGRSYLRLSHQTVSCCLGGEPLTQFLNHYVVH